MPIPRWTWVAALGVACAVFASLPALADDAPTADPPATTAPAADPVALPTSEALDKLLAYTPTGDALWDKYAQALLAVLKDPQTDLKADGAPFIPDNVLAQWEPQFGSDPRYWQLRYFEARRRGESKPGATSSSLLEQGEQRGAVDAATKWCEYIDVDDSLVARATAQPGAAADKAGVLALDALIASYPSESLPWYVRAQLKLGSADWDGALADLKAGNAAEHNRVPLPFPLSIVFERLRSGQPLGSDVVAGVVASNRYQFGGDEPAMIFTKPWKVLVQHLGAQPAPNARIAHDFCCRYATLEGANRIQPIVAEALAAILLRQLLTDQADAFSVEQRRQLLFLYNGWNGRLHDVLRHEIHDHQPVERKYLDDALVAQGVSAGELAQYVLDGDPADRIAQVDDQITATTIEGSGAINKDLMEQGRKLAGEMLVRDPLYRLHVTLTALRLQFTASYHRFEQTTATQRVAEIVAKNASFDWDKVAFPEDK